MPSDFSTPSATSQIRINGALSLQPYGLRPAPSLSTLNPRRYRREPKTRYGMCWVDTFPVALAATSSGALRGAPKIYAKREPLPGQAETRALREVFHPVLRETVGRTDPTRVQSVGPREDDVVPAHRAEVRPPGRSQVLFRRGSGAQHRINLAVLPVDDRREEEHQTARPAHLPCPYG